eukprot:14243166-Alexandrium_andersonii.AAC.1
MNRTEADLCPRAFWGGGWVAVSGCWLFAGASKRGGWVREGGSGGADAGHGDCRRADRCASH